MGGGAVVALAAAARRKRIGRILDAFRVAGATASERAESFDALGLAPSRELDELAERGVLVRGFHPGTWYLSEAAYVAHRDAYVPRRRVLLLVAVVLLLIGAALLIGLSRLQQ